MGFGPFTVPGVPGLGPPTVNPGTKQDHARGRNACHDSGTPPNPGTERSY